MADTWPKTVTFCAHSEKVDMWAIAEQIGLQGEAIQIFKHVGGDLVITAVVNEDGTAEIKSVKG